MRDHVNHCLVMNGGMWGGVKNAVSFMSESVMKWQKRDEYMADLYFLEEMIWPSIKYKQISHDSYCCDRFPNTKVCSQCSYVMGGLLIHDYCSHFRRKDIQRINTSDKFLMPTITTDFSISMDLFVVFPFPAAVERIRTGSMDKVFQLPIRQK